MFKEHLQSIEGIATYAIIGFLIFFIFFILVAIHTYKMDKNRVEKLSHIPLDEEFTNNQE